ncbi:Ankyrin repeat domain-containing protein 50 [Fusarium austroafricanum]|uniref:Ankyrin repeat domain-containing protein 50 n=1 Tax=Fusarium austroafricanum TaxID=2364996 RepID=A0A8H4K004_9HYPO|nr:Ankyrin repeat domain-containing protein 50 [Fusarium austroafricanum]
MLSLVINYKNRDDFSKTQDEVTEIRLVLKSVLKKLVRDATATEQRQRSESTLTRSIDTRLGSNTSDLDYHDAFRTWKDRSEDMIESIIDYPLDQEQRSKYVPSVYDAGSAPVTRSSTVMSREPVSSTSLPTLLETPEETPSHRAQEDVLIWCRQQGYPVDKPSFRCDISDDTVTGSLKGVSPIHQAIKRNNMHILKQMLSWPGCNVDVRLQVEGDNRTPFLLACSERNSHAVELLLTNNAQADATDHTNKTGLHLCQSSISTPEGTRVAKLLLESPKASALDIDARDQYGKTAAHIAARVGDTKMLKYLFVEKSGKKTANPNAKQEDGSTPLMVGLRSDNTSDKKKVIIDILAKAITNENREDVRKIAKKHCENSRGFNSRFLSLNAKYG